MFGCRSICWVLQSILFQSVHRREFTLFRSFGFFEDKIIIFKNLFLYNEAIRRVGQLLGDYHFGVDAIIKMGRPFDIFTLCGGQILVTSL